MLRILYAAGNSYNSKIQLTRFLNSIDYKIKIAAFKNSSPKNINIDWTLDCLLNIYKPEYISLDNKNFEIYFEQIKSYSPDLIISDLEYFTSYIANVLDIPLWQCSSSLINYGIVNRDKYNVGLSKNYGHLLHSNPLENGRLLNILDNSDENFIYSHFGDLNNPPNLKKNYSWIRPYHSIGKKSLPCEHNIVAAISGNNKNIISWLRNHEDSVVFTRFHNEYYENPTVKDINNETEYFCNLKNSFIFACEGQTSFLADAFYNGKYSIVLPNFKDKECIINSVFSEHYKLSSSIHNLNELEVLEVKPKYNNVKFLHEKIEEL